MQRPKMPIKERAKIFAPFDALKGFREMLAQDEIIHEPRIEPSEDLMIELSNTINSLKAGMMVEVKYSCYLFVIFTLRYIIFNFNHHSSF